jgi:hypothetical protein
VSRAFTTTATDTEFTLKAIDRTDNPKCRVTINTDEFTLAEWQAFSRAVEAGFALMKEEA